MNFVNRKQALPYCETQFFFKINNEIVLIILHPTINFSFQSPLQPSCPVPTPESTPSQFLFRKGKVSPDYKQNIAYHIIARLSNPPLHVLRPGNKTHYEE